MATRLSSKTTVTHQAPKPSIGDVIYQFATTASLAVLAGTLGVAGAFMMHTVI